MMPEAFDYYSERFYMLGIRRDNGILGEFYPEKEIVIDKSREYLIGSYLLSRVTEQLDVKDSASPQVTLLGGEFPRYMEKFHRVPRREAKITDSVVYRYCDRYNLAGLAPLLIERLTLERK